MSDKLWSYRVIAYDNGSISMLLVSPSNMKLFISPNPMFIANQNTYTGGIDNTHYLSIFVGAFKTNCLNQREIGRWKVIQRRDIRKGGQPQIIPRSGPALGQC